MAFYTCPKCGRSVNHEIISDHRGDEVWRYVCAGYEIGLCKYYYVDMPGMWNKFPRPRVNNPF